MNPKVRTGFTRDANVHSASGWVWHFLPMKGQLALCGAKAHDVNKRHRPHGKALPESAYKGRSRAHWCGECRRLLK